MKVTALRSSLGNSIQFQCLFYLFRKLGIYQGKGKVNRCLFLFFLLFLVLKRLSGQSSRSPNGLTVRPWAPFLLFSFLLLTGSGFWRRNSNSFRGRLQRIVKKDSFYPILQMHFNFLMVKLYTIVKTPLDSSLVSFSFLFRSQLSQKIKILEINHQPALTIGYKRFPLQYSVPSWAKQTAADRRYFSFQFTKDFRN
jgi:hypothetical protein